MNYQVGLDFLLLNESGIQYVVDKTNKEVQNEIIKFKKSGSLRRRRNLLYQTIYIGPHIRSVSSSTKTGIDFFSIAFMPVESPGTNVSGNPLLHFKKAKKNGH